MDSTLWKINDENASGFAKDVNINLVSLQADSLQFNADGQPFDGAALFDFEDAFSLYKGDVRWFKGVVVSSPRFGSPTAEGHDYEVAGLWWYLERSTFRQDWRSGQDGILNKEHVILGKDIDNEYISVGAVIKEVLDHVIAQGAPFTYIDAELDVLTAVPPTDEQTNISHGEAIRKMLWCYPDLQTHFDYSAEIPVLHFERRAAATAVQLACADGISHENIDIRSREDLVRDGVRINYERIDTIDGERIPQLQTDTAGTTTNPFRTASFAVNIAGSQLATQSTEVTVQELGDYTEKEFWINHLPELAEKVDLKVNSGTVSEVPLVSELKKGVVPEWTGKETLDVVFTAKLSWTEENKTEVSKADYSISVVTTDAETRKYTKELSYTVAESFPTGLATALLDALSVVHWQGTFQTVEEECTGGIYPGNVLNLTNGLAVWASMRAVIQQVNYDLDQGRTSITFGPPEHLSPQDHITLLNANRNRITLYSGDSRATGNASGGEDVGTGGVTPNSSGAGTLRYKKFVITDGDNGDYEIILDTASLKKSQVVVVEQSEEDGITKMTGRFSWPRLHKVEEEEEA